MNRHLLLATYSSYQLPISYYQVTHRRSTVFIRSLRRVAATNTVWGGPSVEPQNSRKGRLSVNISTKVPRGLTSPGKGPSSRYRTVDVLGLKRSRE